MSDPMDTDGPSQAPLDQSLDNALFPPNASTPPLRQVSRLSHPPPPIDSPVLSAAQTPSKPSPPTISMTKEDTPTPVNNGAAAAVTMKSGATSGQIESEKGAGAPVRQYLNEFVTPYLLEGMKMLAKEQPPKPLETLGRYLIQQAQTLEANAAAGTDNQSRNQIHTNTSTPGPSAGTPAAGPSEVKMEEAV
ncbi:hypothetical protein ABW20_dc0110579 [Dactylellina cionopaga]|nr:hypothetical protein ABW20_dc0110579 [Dactylellina cionopaga]